MRPPKPSVCSDVFFSTLRMMRHVLPHAQAQAVTAKKVDQHYLPPPEGVDHAVAVEETAHYNPPHTNEAVAHHHPLHTNTYHGDCSIVVFTKL